MIGRLASSAINMIVIINISAKYACNADRDLLSAMFSEVARASLLGDHRVIISRSLSKWAAHKLDLTERHRQHILRIGQEYTQLGSQISRAKFKVFVEDGITGVESRGGGEWAIGVEEALPGGYLSPSQLVLEHATNDGEFYDLIFRMHAKRSGFGNISYQIIHGGGSSCCDEIRRLAAQRRAVSCICDTDRKTPLGAASATFNAVISERGKSNPLGILTGTPGREAENFLPPEIVQILSDKTETVGKLIGLMARQGPDVEAGDCLWLFYDIKDGFPCGTLENYCRSPQSRQWICQKYDIEENSIGEFSMPALGSNILRDFMNSDRLRREMHLHVRSSYWTTHFQSWMDEVLWFLAGRKHERVS